MPPQPKSQDLIDAFTKNIEKIPIKVVIHTDSETIIGEFHSRTNLRLIDEIINGDQYLAITNADVYEKTSKAHLRTKFLVLNREKVVMIIPWEEIERKGE